MMNPIAYVIVIGSFVIALACIAVLYRQIEKEREKHEERERRYLRYMKPDTYGKIKGADDLKKVVQQMLFEQHKKTMNSVKTLLDEFQVINKIQ
jgi:hypothetical protein